MDVIRGLLERLAASWRTMSFNQRAIVATVVVAAGLSAVIFSFWIQSDTMVALYGNLAPEEAAAAIDYVTAQGIEVELSHGGTTILVPSEHVSRLRMELAVEGIGGPRRRLEFGRRRLFGGRSLLLLLRRRLEHLLHLGLRGRGSRSGEQ